MPSPILEVTAGRANLFFVPVHKTSVEPGFNLREIDYDADPEEVAKLDPELEPLARSIAEHGVRQTCFGSMVDGKFRITDGHRRRCGVRLCLARKWLKKTDPKTHLPVLPDPQDRRKEDQRIVDSIALNSGKPYALVETARGVARLVGEFGYSEEKVAKDTGDSITHIRNCLLLMAAHPDWLAAVRQEEVAATTVIELVRVLPDLDAQLAALEQAREKADGGRITPKHLPVATGRIKHQEDKEKGRQGDKETTDAEATKAPEVSPSPTLPPSPSSFEGAEPDTATTNEYGEFISGVEDVSIDFGHSKVKVTLHLVEEAGKHYYGLTLKWPGQRQGDGFLHEKATRVPAFASRGAVMLAALQRVHGELGSREFKGHAELMAELDRQIAAVGTALNPTPHTPPPSLGSATTNPATAAKRWDVSCLFADGRESAEASLLTVDLLNHVNGRLIQQGLREIVITPAK